MWIRLRFDIPWTDLTAGAVSCGFAGDRRLLSAHAEQFWAIESSPVVSLSVRSGFDLLLQALQLPPKSEVLMSALTVPDMARIVEQHGLVPIPVDLERDGSAPCLASLQRVITPASRVLVLAHLFGSRIPMAPFIEVAKRHSLLVVEDCAQAFCGASYVGDPESDAAMFSFGPIKTATALGGAVIHVNNAVLADRMRNLQSSYRIQSRSAYFRRLVRYGMLKALSSRRIFGAVAKVSAFLGVNQDILVSNQARSFSSDGLIEQIRQQPSAPQLSMLLRRWRRYDNNRLRRRAQRGGEMCRQLGEAPSHATSWECDTHWLLPVLVDNPQETIRKLRILGYDATRRTRLSVIPPPPGRESLDPTNVRTTVSKLVILPWYPELTEEAVQQLIHALPHARPLSAGMLRATCPTISDCCVVGSG